MSESKSLFGNYHEKAHILSLEEIHQNGISRAGEKFLQRFRSFFVK